MKEQTRQRRFRLSDIPAIMKEGLLAILHGDLFLRLKVDRYFPQIAYTFLLFALSILSSFIIDVNLAEVENNKKILKELEILNTQKRYELVTLNRRSTVQELLKESGSEVTEPQKPASILKK